MFNYLQEPYSQSNLRKLLYAYLTLNAQID